MLMILRRDVGERWHVVEHAQDGKQDYPRLEELEDKPVDLSVPKLLPPNNISEPHSYSRKRKLIDDNIKIRVNNDNKREKQAYHIYIYIYIYIYI